VEEGENEDSSTCEPEELNWSCVTHAEVILPDTKRGVLEKGRGGDEDDKGEEVQRKGEDPSRVSKAWTSGGRLTVLCWAMR